MLKQSLLAAALAALFSISALTPTLAAEPLRSAPRIVYQAPFNWTGFYVGVNAGYGSGTVDTNVGVSWNTKGGAIGGTVGYNWQIGQVVLGLEGDLDWTSASGSFGPVSTKMKWLATERVRVGYAWDKFLIFGTGGLAQAKIQGSVFGLSESQVHTGWVMGLGGEYAFNKSWSAKAEYLYVALGSKDYSGVSGSAQTNIVRAGLNYRF